VAVFEEPLAHSQLASAARIALVPGGAKKTNFRKDRYFRKSFKVLLQQSFFAGALNRGICKNPAKDFCWWDLDGVCLVSS
jgi:hypothetical protein